MKLKKIIIKCTELSGCNYDFSLHKHQQKEAYRVTMFNMVALATYSYWELETWIIQIEMCNKWKNIQ